MKTQAYLDDYRLIRIENFDSHFENEIKVKQGEDFLVFHMNEKKEIILENDINIEEDVFVVWNNTFIKAERRLILHTARFEEEYLPDLNTLGSFYSKEETRFAFWAPFKKKVELVYNNQIMEMTRGERYVYEATVKEDCDCCRYHFLVNDEDNKTSFLDPFAYVKDRNEIDSIVIDTDRIAFEKITPEPVKQRIIMEVSVRDFSMYPGIFKNPGKIIAFKEEGLKIDSESAGLDYLKEVGITHLEWLPILDYDNDKSSYNWGYNPLHYNYFKEDYLVGDDPYEKLEEVRSTIACLHKNNIRVILDVVFNHVYSKENFMLNRILPHYFYRYIGTKMADGAGLSNELRTECGFMRRYLKIMMKRLVDLYDIDGLRYDLSGLVDLSTMKQIDELIKKDKADFLTIGEGWVMGEALPKDNAGNYQNADLFKEALFFNPEFRDVIRGTGEKEGILKGNLEQKEAFKKIFTGNSDCLKESQSLNYLECHDNATLFDWLMRIGNGEAFEHVKQRAIYGLSLVILAKGTPFVQIGQDFLRSKKGLDNTYNAPDEINEVDWKRRKCYRDTVKIFKELIFTRKAIEEYYDKEWKYSDYYELTVVECADLKILVNACPFHHIYTDGNRYKTIFDGVKTCEVFDMGINIEPYTVVVAKQL